MDFKEHLNKILLGIILTQILTCQSLPCDSCGKECASACGTKHFRTCCFNYLRKRTDPNAMKMKIMDKRLIDIMMLKGRTFFTQNNHLNDDYNDNNNDDRMESGLHRIRVPYMNEAFRRASSSSPSSPSSSSSLSQERSLQAQGRSREFFRNPYNATLNGIVGDLKASFYDD